MKSERKTSILILALMIAVSISVSSMKAQTSLLTYTDQNNNTYKISGTEVEYDPITKMESSSGEYDGGDPWKKQIDKETFKKINSLFEEIIADKKSLLDKRTKPSIVLTVKKGKKKEKSYITKRNEKLDEYMRGLK